MANPPNTRRFSPAAAWGKAKSVMKRHWFSTTAAVGIAAISAGTGISKTAQFNSSVESRAKGLKSQKVSAPHAWASLGTKFWQPKKPFPFTKNNIRAMNIVSSLASNLAKAEGRKLYSEKDLVRVVNTIEGNRKALDRVGYDVWYESLVKKSGFSSSELKPELIAPIVKHYWNASVEETAAIDSLCARVRTKN